MASSQDHPAHAVCWAKSVGYSGSSRSEFNGDPNWMGGYFFMGLFAGAPVGKHVISGGETYYTRTVTQFSNWKNFFDTTLTQSPQSPP